MSYQNEQEFRENAGYQIGDDWYPRVTKIVDIKSKPSLYHFYSEVGFKNGEQIKNDSANEGTLVHEAVEKIMIGEEPTSIPPLIIPAVNAFRRWRERLPYPLETSPDLIERRIIHPEFRYAGTADALVKIGDRFGLLDIKTSKAVWRDYNLQTAAYFDALRVDFPNLSTRWILRIDQLSTCLNCGATKRLKGGREKINRPFPNNGSCSPTAHVWSDIQGIIELKELPGDHRNDFEAFLGAKRLWEWENEFWLRRIGYL